MSSFSEYYKKWKEENGIEKDTPYRKSTNEEISAHANNYIDNILMPKIRENMSKYSSTTKTTVNTTTPTESKENSFFDNMGKTVENGWLGLVNGIKNSGQIIGRAITDTQADRADEFNKMREKMLKKRLKEHPEEAEQIRNTVNNPLISGEQIREHSREIDDKINQEKNNNILKIQQNEESIDNPVGKYIAGNIAPAIGQMLPRNGWRRIR